MASMSTNEESHRRNYVYSLQLTNWGLDSGTTFHMTPNVSNFLYRDRWWKQINISNLHMGILLQQYKQDKFK